ncbi:hypothetical protein NL676_012604 [Syzygium grande]|nr:hypothetical protein NL676_012604 [Syzygium grande]
MPHEAAITTTRIGLTRSNRRLRATAACALLFPEAADRPPGFSEGRPLPRLAAASPARRWSASPDSPTIARGKLALARPPRATGRRPTSLNLARVGLAS